MIQRGVEPWRAVDLYPFPLQSNTGVNMPIVFTSLYLEHCIRYCDKRPRQNLIIEKDLFTGKYNVLNAG